MERSNALKNMAEVGGPDRHLLTDPLRCRRGRKAQLFPLSNQGLLGCRVWSSRFVGLVRLGLTLGRVREEKWRRGVRVWESSWEVGRPDPREARGAGGGT